MKELFSPILLTSQVLCYEAPLPEQIIRIQKVERDCSKTSSYNLITISLLWELITKLM